MNSYPPELLTQLAPVMFVAGLDAPTPTSPSPKLQDFNTLTLRLREALQSQRKVAFWQSEKSKTFHILLVDKEVRFPPRKLMPSDDPQFAAAHSPLSPLTPSSPLYPDGLIAPIWIRKHTTLVPSVFVLFARIFEFPPHNPRSPLDLPSSEREREREQEERRRDNELAAEVSMRKKSTTERGIKLTLVLMASRKMLDDPTLDARLSYIRRQSGLDSRAALFVLSPVSPGELSEFVNSLQQALYEPALEYYTAHSKRVRRKRNRHSQATAYPNPAVLGSINIARPLRPDGWTVRYECKMACFAEFRGQDEVALKHYQDAHNTLVVMFGSTAILPPRTKRWAEAKVLADCINIKIAKLYLYNNEHSLALAHHSSHMRLFSDFSRGWGIGEETYEFWSWMARQHRVLAEILEQGMRANLTLPVHKVHPAASVGVGMAASQFPSSNNLRGTAQTSALELESLRTLGINPSHALQHPGFYYYMAARCTEMRREKFLAALESQRPSQLSPGFANEKKTDHLAVILELYTKSYELFKKYATSPSPNATQGRLTLWIAYRIAQTYYDSGKFDMAVRFFERIAKTYRREKWHSMLRPLLSTWYACAQQLGDVDLSVKLLVEQLGQDLLATEDPNSIEEDFLAVLKSTVPSSDVLSVDLSESPIFNSNVVFWVPEVKVGEIAAFQLSLAAPTSPAISSLPFSSLAMYFSHRSSPIVVRHSDAIASHSLSQIADLGLITSSEARDITANLRWQPCSCITFTGTLSSEVPISAKMSKLVLTISEGPWNIELLLSPCGFRRGLTPIARWLSVVDPPRYVPVKWESPSSINFRHRPHDLTVTLAHEPPAYLNENYPITIDITNTDDRELEVVVDVLLQPTELDNAVNTIVLEDERSTGFIKGVSFGVLASGVRVIKTLYLMNTGAAGNRMVDISVQSRPTSSEETDDSLEFQDVTETLETLIVPAVDPIEISQTVTYSHSLSEWPGLADLRTFDADFWDDRFGGEAHITSKIACVGPSEIEIENIKLEREDRKMVKVVSCSVDDEDEDYPSEYYPGDELAHVCRIAFAHLGDEGANNNTISSPGSYHIHWRRIRKNGERGSSTISAFPLPSLSPPVESLVALLGVPPTATLHIPTTLTLTLRNYHPSRSASVTVQLELDASEGFVIAGLRSGRVPILMPGSEEKLTWELIPIECGYVKVPRIKVMDLRRAAVSETESGTEGVEAKGEMVKVIDVRIDRRTVSDGQSRDFRPEASGILVLP